MCAVCREIEKERDCERREKEKDQYRWVRVRIRVWGTLIITFLMYPYSVAHFVCFSFCGILSGIQFIRLLHAVLDNLLLRDYLELQYKFSHIFVERLLQRYAVCSTIISAVACEIPVP